MKILYPYREQMLKEEYWAGFRSGFFIGCGGAGLCLYVFFLL